MTSPPNTTPSSEVPTDRVSQVALQTFSLIYILILYKKAQSFAWEILFLMKREPYCDYCFVIFFLMCLQVFLYQYIQIYLMPLHCCVVLPKVRVPRP